MKEIWKDIVGYEGFYQISNMGRIKSLARVIIKKNNRKNTVKERILKNQKHPSGYSMIGLRFGDFKKSHLIHRLVAIAFLENKENKSQVNHKDCNKKNNSVLNLEWSTNKENAHHASVNNLLWSPSGEDCHFSKRKACDILNIRKMYSSGNYTMKEIAQLYNTSTGYVCDVVNRKLWKNI